MEPKTGLKLALAAASIFAVYKVATAEETPSLFPVTEPNKTTNTSTSTSTPKTTVFVPTLDAALKKTWSQLTIEERTKFGVEWLAVYLYTRRNRTKEYLKGNQLFKLPDYAYKKTTLEYVASKSKELKKAFPDVQIMYFKKYGTNVISDYKISTLSMQQANTYCGGASTCMAVFYNFNKWLDTLTVNPNFKGI